jgi:hypothetical protein
VTFSCCPVLRLLLEPDFTAHVRLYIVLYARLKDPQPYHYALHISPNIESFNPIICNTTKFHYKNSLRSVEGKAVISWVYEAVKVNPHYDDRILVRVLLAEFTQEKALEHFFAEVPVVQGDTKFNCITWVRQALLRLKEAKITRMGDWDSIQRTALDYVQKKKQQGRFEASWEGNSSGVATFDMISGVEITP